MNDLDPALRMKFEQLSTQIANYRREAQEANRPRRQLFGVWTAVAMAWIAACAVSLTAVLALAGPTAALNDGKIAWVVFVSFVAAAVATGIGYLVHLVEE
jgi:ABC-type transport system involved in cytochrome bd biosynthesis fused ATPase/permease subunit